MLFLIIIYELEFENSFDIVFSLTWQPISFTLCSSYTWNEQFCLGDELILVWVGKLCISTDGATFYLIVYLPKTGIIVGPIIELFVKSGGEISGDFGTCTTGAGHVYKFSVFFTFNNLCPIIPGIYRRCVLIGDDILNFLLLADLLSFRSVWKWWFVWMLYLSMSLTCITRFYSPCPLTF